MVGLANLDGFAFDSRKHCHGPSNEDDGERGDTTAMQKLSTERCAESRGTNNQKAGVWGTGMLMRQKEAGTLGTAEKLRAIT